MGPPDLMPPFPLLDTYEREGYRLMPGTKYDYPCNRLQILENAMDPVHTSFLHAIVSSSQFTDEFGVIPDSTSSRPQPVWSILPLGAWATTSGCAWWKT